MTEPEKKAVLRVADSATKVAEENVRLRAKLAQAREVATECARTLRPLVRLALDAGHPYILADVCEGAEAADAADAFLASLDADGKEAGGAL